MSTPYFFIELLMFIFACVATRRDDATNKRCFAFICILWTLVFGLRGYSVGNDTQNYVYFFLDRSPYDGYGAIYKGSNMEPGFIFISRIIKFFFDSPTIWFTILSGWLFFIIYKLYTKYCGPQNSFLSLLTVFIIANSFVTLMVATRQSMAFCVLLTGLYILSCGYWTTQSLRDNILRNNKFKLGFIVFLLSIFVHKSILILISIIALAYFIRINKKIMYIMIAVSFVFSFFWLNEIGTFFNLFFMSLSDYAENSEVVRSDIMSIYAEDFGGNVQKISTLLAWSCPLCLTIYLADEEQIQSFFFKLLVISVCIFLLFNTTYLIERINTLLILLGFIKFLPTYAFREKKWRLAYILFVFILLVKAMWRYDGWPTSDDSCIPYYFVWE